MFTFKVVPDSGEPFELKAGTRDVLTWEKTTKGKSYGQLVSEPNLVDYYKLAHIAAWRQQLFTGTLKEFEESHDIDLTGDREKVARIEEIVAAAVSAEDALAAIREVLGDEEDASDDEPDPTPPGHSSGPSSPSQSGPGSRRKSGQTKAPKQS